jgi:hypothetical protein
MTLGFDRIFRVTGGKMAAIALLSVVGGATGSCTSQANNGLSIVWAQEPKADKTGCTIPGTRGMTYKPDGILDVGLDQAYPYNLYPLVENNLFKAKSMMVEYNKIRITGTDVKLVPPPGVVFTPAAGCPAEFFHPNPLSIEPEGEAAIAVQAIKPCHVPVLQDMFTKAKPAGLSPDVSAFEIFTAVIRVRGVHGGTEIISEPFEFPIRVCLGCLQRDYRLKGFEDFDYLHIPDCRSLLDNPFPGYACNIAQDFGPVLCCSPDGTKSNIECPGVPRGVVPPAP